MHAEVMKKEQYVTQNIGLKILHTKHFIMKILNKQEHQQIACSHSSDIDFKYFLNLYKISTAKSYSFLVIDDDK